MNRPNTAPRFVISTTFSQYKKYLKIAYSTSLVAVTLVVLLPQLARTTQNGGFSDPSILNLFKIIAVFFILSQLFNIAIILFDKVVVSGDKVIHYFLFIRSSVRLSDIEEVIYIESYSYIVDGYSPLSRIFVKKKNGKFKTYKLVSSMFYSPNDIQKLAQTIAERSGAKLIERKQAADSIRKIA